MIHKFSDLEKYSNFIICGILAIILIGCFNTPFLLHIELENIFNSFLINQQTNNLISINLEATSIPPLFFWLKHLVINTFGFNIEMLKLIPATMMCAIIIISYMFIARQTGSNAYGLITSIILATSPFFITASKLVSLDLIYIIIYISTTFIFTANIYSNKYSQFNNFIAGILIACCFSLTGLIGTLPIIANFLLVNVIRGGFFINLKFNNPLVIATGFISFTVIWATSLGNTIGFENALELIFNYQFINDLANFQFNEEALFKYSTLFIIGGFPWIALLPAGLFNTLITLNKRLSTSNLQTSLPLICLVNAFMLSVYFATVEQEFYILLTIYFNFAILIADRIYSIEINKGSIVNFIFVAYSIGIMMLFLNEFLNINLTTYHFDTTIKQLLINENTSIAGISDSVFYILATAYFICAILMFIYTISQSKLALNISFATAIINLVIFVFAVFPNLQNAELNNSRSIESWLNYNLKDKSKTLTFYKLKEPTVAAMAKESFYFDDIIKMDKFIKENKAGLSYVFFNSEDKFLVSRISKKSRVQCRNKICLMKLK